MDFPGDDPSERNVFSESVFDLDLLSLLFDLSLLDFNLDDLSDFFLPDFEFDVVDLLVASESFSEVFSECDFFDFFEEVLPLGDFSDLSDDVDDFLGVNNLNLDVFFSLDWDGGVFGGGDLGGRARVDFNWEGSEVLRAATFKLPLRGVFRGLGGLLISVF